MVFRIIIIIIFLCAIVGCKNEEQTEPLSKKLSLKKAALTIDFPDTVLIGEKYQGMIYYTSPLDTINIEKEDRRYVFFFVRGAKDTLGLQELLKTEHDTFVAVKKGKIPFWDISFREEGRNYIDGYIKDQVILHNYYPKKNKSRVITNTSRVVLPIYAREN